MHSGDPYKLRAAHRLQLQPDFTNASPRVRRIRGNEPMNFADLFCDTNFANYRVHLSSGGREIRFALSLRPYLVFRRLLRFGKRKTLGDRNFTADRSNVQ